VMITLNCGGCGAIGPVIEPWVTSGYVPCTSCGEDVDIAHAYRHAGWCTACGEDMPDCECEPVYSCGSCGLLVDGVVCRECRECPEPAGYWAWDETLARDYLITLDRAAAREKDPALSDVIMAHHRVMCEAFNLSD
jgi:hypothetical protein